MLFRSDAGCDFLGKDTSAADTHWWKIEELFFYYDSLCKLLLRLLRLFSTKNNEILYYKWNAHEHKNYCYLQAIVMQKFYTPKIVA